MDTEVRIERSDAPHCTSCQAVVTSAARWCGRCGARLWTADAGAVVDADGAPPGSRPGPEPPSPAAPSAATPGSASRVGAAIVAAIVLVVAVVTGLAPDEVRLVPSGVDGIGTDAVDPDGEAAGLDADADDPGVASDDPGVEVVPRADTFALSPTTDTGERPVCVAGDACLVWTHEHPGRGPVWRDASTDRDLLVLTDRLGTTAIDLANGAVRWRIEADPTADTGSRGHAVSDSLVVLIERDGVLRGYDRATGSLQWISPLPAAVRVRQAVDHGDVVVVLTDAVAGAAGAVRLLAGFDRATGERRWLRRATSATSTTRGPVVFDGPRNLRGLDPATGLVRWEAEVAGPLGSVVGVGGSVVYVGWERSVVADAEDGPGAATVGPPPALVTVDHAESIVLLGDDRIELVTDSGSQWAVPPPDDACCLAATVLDGDVVVVDGDGGGRTVLDGRDGSVLARNDGRDDGVFAGTAWLASDGDRLPGRQAEADPAVVALDVFDARGDRRVATTPPAIAVAGVDDGVVVAGAGWVSRIRTD